MGHEENTFVLTVLRVSVWILLNVIFFSYSLLLHIIVQFSLLGLLI